jgi:hypothetical protein
LGGAGADSYKLYCGSPCFEAGTSLATEMGCTASVDCYDYFGSVIPYDEDGAGGAQWDIGVFEKQTQGCITPKIYELYRGRRIEDGKIF